jgi:hypothetical protein
MLRSTFNGSAWAPWGLSSVRAHLDPDSVNQARTRLDIDRQGGIQPHPLWTFDEVFLVDQEVQRRFNQSTSDLRQAVLNGLN